MSTLDKAPEGGKFRGKAAAGLNATAGAFGQGDLLTVSIDGSGTLAVGAATTATGIILTTEGKQNSTHADYKKVVGGDFYTVVRRGEFVECDSWTSPTVSAGDVLYAASSGDVTSTASDEAVVLGHVVQGDGTSGMIFVCDVGGSVPTGILSGADITTAVVDGAAAGNVTVTGIATTDTLVSVVRLGENVETHAVVNGTAAGDVTVTGVATADRLVSVHAFSKSVHVMTAVAGAAAGNVTVTGIATTDTLVSVINVDIGGDAIADLTAEFTIDSADTIDNAGGTSSADGVLLVVYRDSTSDEVTDLTSEFSIASADTINNAAGTDTTGRELLVVYEDATDQAADLTSEFTIASANTINNAAGTASTGDRLLVIYTS